MANVGDDFLIVNWTFLGLATVVVFLRLYARAFRLRSLHRDDYLTIAAWILAVLYSAVLTDAVRYGLGQHMEDVDPAYTHRVQVEIAVSRAPAVFVPYCIRVSFSCTLLLIIRGTRHDTIRWIIRGNLVVETVVCIVGLVAMYAGCGGKDAVCKHLVAAEYGAYVQSAVNCLSNITLASIPFWLVRKMNLPRDIKAGTLLLSILGIATFSASIAKAIEVYNVSSMGPDLTYIYARLQISICLENNILMILGSLPLLRPLYKSGSRRRKTIPITIGGVDRVTRRPGSFALQDQGRPDWKIEKDSDSRGRSSTSEDRILGDTALYGARESVHEKTIPSDRIKVHTAVDVTYDTPKEDEPPTTDELVQQRIMFGV